MHVFLTILAIVAIVLVVVMVVLYFLGKKAEEAGRIAGTDAGRIPDSNHSCH